MTSQPGGEQDSTLLSDEQSTPAHQKSAIVAQRKEVHYMGPTPSPEHVAAYERLLPGAANRFLILAEGEADHRRRLENKHLEHMTESSRRAQSLSARGQLFAFIIAMGGMAGGIYLSINSSPIPGSIIGGGGLATIILAFLQKREPPKIDDDSDAT